MHIITELLIELKNQISLVDTNNTFTQQHPTVVPSALQFNNFPSAPSDRHQLHGAGHEWARSLYWGRARPGPAAPDHALPTLSPAAAARSPAARSQNLRRNAAAGRRRQLVARGERCETLPANKWDAAEVLLRRFPLLPQPIGEPF